MTTIIDIKTDDTVLRINGKLYLVSFEDLYEQHGNDNGLYILEYEEDD